MKKILITLFLITGLSFLSLNAQKPLKKPTKQQNTQTATASNKPAKQQAGNKLNNPAKPQKTQTQSSTFCVAATGTIKGHGYVDLGLSVKWATCNVGASSPSDYGDYFAWGETKTKSKYTEDNSVTYEKSMGDISGDSLYDAARANWGGTWRLPTKAEIDELIKKCKTWWITYNGKKGRLVTGPNGKSIFLPAAGAHSYSSLDYVGEYGFYWSSTPHKSYIQSSYDLDFGSGGFDRNYHGRGGGSPVRPVSE